MAKLTPIELEDGTVVYIESPEDVDVTETTAPYKDDEDDEEETLTAKGGGMERPFRNSNLSKAPSGLTPPTP